MPGRSSTTVSRQRGKSFVSPLLLLVIIYPARLFSSSVAEVVNIDTELIRPLAAKFNLSFTTFGEVITDPSAPSSGSVALFNYSTRLEPAPTSPYKDSVAFDILSGTIKSVYNIHRGLGGNDNIKVYPTCMSANTGRTDRRSRLSADSRSSIDTRYYWKLSENIYRYGHGNGLEMEGLLGGIHTINESTSISLFLKLLWLTRSDRRSGCGQLVGDYRVLRRSHSQR